MELKFAGTRSDSPGHRRPGECCRYNLAPNWTGFSSGTFGDQFASRARADAATPGRRSGFSNCGARVTRPRSN